MYNRLRFYGQFNSYWSNCNVSRGLVTGLLKNGVDIEVYDETGKYLDVPRGTAEAWGPDTAIAAFVGYPALAQRLISHRFKVGFYIAESSVLPPPWQVMLAATSLIVAPSKWMADVFQRNGAKPDSVRVVPHGLDPVYGASVPPRVIPKEPLHFLHIAGARDFLHRKGTFALIDAFANVFSREGAPPAVLTIRTPPNPPVGWAVDRTGSRDLFALDFHNEPLSPQDMRAYYLAKPWSAIIQPSRAEAFGIVPLEARALGFPVILSDCAGHRQHVEPQDILVLAGPEDAMKANGIPDGRAPVVTVEAIESALEYFLNNRVEATTRAVKAVKGYYDKYTWANLTRKLAEELKAVSRRMGKGRSLGEKLGTA